MQLLDIRELKFQATQKMHKLLLIIFILMKIVFMNDIVCIELESNGAAPLIVKPNETD